MFPKAICLGASALDACSLLCTGHLILFLFEGCAGTCDALLHFATIHVFIGGYDSLFRRNGAVVASPYQGRIKAVEDRLPSRHPVASRSH